MLAYVDLSCGKCGPSLELCWPSLGLCWPILKAMWADLEAYVGRLCWPMLTQLEPKDPKHGNSKKHCKTQDILMVGGLSWAMLAHLGAMLAYLEGNAGPSWGYVAHLGAMLAHLGAMLAHLGAMLPHLGAMLAHLGGYVGPS